MKCRCPEIGIPTFVKILNYKYLRDTENFVVAGEDFVRGVAPGPDAFPGRALAYKAAPLRQPDLCPRHGPRGWLRQRTFLARLRYHVDIHQAAEGMCILDIAADALDLLRRYIHDHIHLEPRFQIPGFFEQLRSCRPCHLRARYVCSRECIVQGGAAGGGDGKAAVASLYRTRRDDGKANERLAGLSGKQLPLPPRAFIAALQDTFKGKGFLHYASLRSK